MPAPPNFWRSPRLKRSLPTPEITIPDPPPEPSGGGNNLLYMVLPVALMALVMVVIGLATGMTTMLYFSVPLILASSIASTIIFFVQRRKTREEKELRKVKYRAMLDGYEQDLQQLYQEQYRLRNENDPAPGYPRPDRDRADRFTGQNAEPAYDGGVAQTLAAGAGPDVTRVPDDARPGLNQAFDAPTRPAASKSCLDRVTERDRSLWSRSPNDDDFLVVRLGLGELPTTVRVKTPTSRDALDPDPLIGAAQEMASKYASIKGVPICLDLRQARVAGIAGDELEAQNMAFAMAVQLATHHAPTEVKIAAIYPEEETEDWAWMRWLPHTWHDDRTIRYLAHDREQARHVLSQLEEIMDNRQRMADETYNSEGPTFDTYFIVFLAEEHLNATDSTIQRLIFEGPELGIIPLVIAGRAKELPKSCQEIIRIGDSNAQLIHSGTDVFGTLFTPDTASFELLHSYALAMAPIRLRRSAARDIPSSVTLLELLDVSAVESLDVAKRWDASQTHSKFLPAAIGVTGGGEPLILDLHEKAHGPNGLVAGMVGAGKSELLQTLVAVLAINFHPHRLGFVLVDYKGGGMAEPFVDLPHTQGVITNLQQESLATRALTSFAVELEQRQKRLKAAKVTHIDDYQRLYYQGKVDTPMPYLVVIVDEFAEMKTEQPEIAKEFVRIARVGRALGLRLILAMQKPAGIVDGQIEANTRFRLCLRVAQTEDSQAMLKRKDAAYLTQIGRAYLQVGASELFREFQVAWSGAPYDPTATASGDPKEIVAVNLTGERQTLYTPALRTDIEEISQLKAVVRHLAEVAQAAEIERLPTMWLSPLEPQITLDQVTGDEGWDGNQWRPVSGWLTPKIGLVDEPTLKRQRPLALPLGTEGHLAIYSAPGYGKTIAVQTLVTALVSDHSPEDVNLYILDFGGRLLKQFEPLPHVGSVITADEEERLRRFILILRRTLDERRALFGEAGVNDLPGYRKKTGHKLPAWVVIVDNYANLMEATEEDESIQSAIVRVAQDGGNLGVHLVLTASNSPTIRFSVSSNILLAIALHLVDSSEYSALVGRTQLIPEALPGRGLLRGKPPLECQIALPCDGETDAERNENLRAMVERMRAAWSGVEAMPIKTLPERLPLSEANSLSPQKKAAPAAAFGVYVDDLSPMGVDLESGPNFLIAGPMQSGKSTLLRSWAHALSKAHTPEALQMIILDSQRRTLADLENLPNVVAYTATQEDANEALHAVKQWVERQREARDANTESGLAPKLVLFVDDLYDPYDDPLTESAKSELGALLRQGRGLGLHLIISGPAGELPSKAWTDPIKTLKEAQMGFMMGSGDDALFTIRIPYQERQQMLPVGEGYYVNRNHSRRVKIATPD